MTLSTFVFVLLIFCIPYLGYIRNSINPRNGFSILFVSLICTTALINFDIFVAGSLLLLIISIFMKNKIIEISLFFLSFLLLNIFLFNSFNTGLWNYLVKYLLPISLISGVFSLMMIGHWFLVDPTISKEGMKRMALPVSYTHLRAHET